MSFLTRWDDDHSRPKFTSALRDVFRARRAAGRRPSSSPSWAWDSCSRDRCSAWTRAEDGVSTWFEDQRTASVQHDHELHVDGRQHRDRHRGRRHRVRARLVAHQGVVVCRRAALAISLQARVFVSPPPRSAGTARRSSGSTPPRRPRAIRAVTSVPRPRSTSSFAMMAPRIADLVRAPGRHRALRPRAAARRRTPASIGARTTSRTSSWGMVNGVHLHAAGVELPAPP